MNEQKQQQLMRAARRVAPVTAPEGFADDVMRTIRRVGASTPRSAGSLADELGRWFPRIAVASLVVIAGAVAFEVIMDGDVISQMTSAPDQWLVPVDWL